MEITDGKPTNQDPDGLIYEVAWKSAEQIKDLDFSFPEDKDFILSYIAQLESINGHKFLDKMISISSNWIVKPIIYRLNENKNFVSKL
ncbi:hypothetical protein ABEX20_35385 [Brevibacillus reuszeri]